MLLPYWLRERLLNTSFQKKMGYRMDFNNPQTFNEKIQWCKLYYYHPDSKRIADKVAFKSYIKELDYLIALLEKAERHKAVVAIDKHSLSILKGIIGNRQRDHQGEQM